MSTIAPTGDPIPLGETRWGPYEPWTINQPTRDDGERARLLLALQLIAEGNFSAEDAKRIAETALQC